MVVKKPYFGTAGTNFLTLFEQEHLGFDQLKPYWELLARNHLFQPVYYFGGWGLGPPPSQEVLQESPATEMFNESCYKIRNELIRPGSNTATRKNAGCTCLAAEELVEGGGAGEDHGGAGDLDDPSAEAVEVRPDADGAPGRQGEGGDRRVARRHLARDQARPRGHAAGEEGGIQEGWSGMEQSASS